jgi:hypothetical protein
MLKICIQVPDFRKVIDHLTRSGGIPGGGHEEKGASLIILGNVLHRLFALLLFFLLFVLIALIVLVLQSIPERADAAAQLTGDLADPSHPEQEYDDHNDQDQLWGTKSEWHVSLLRSHNFTKFTAQEPNDQ